MAAAGAFVTYGSGVQVMFNGQLVVWTDPAVEAARRAALQPFSRAEYRDALRALAPSGPAWPDAPQTVFMRVLDALAAELGRVDQRAAQLLQEASAATTSELLPDWERVVGLPDPCVTAPQTVSERREALQGRLTSVGGQSRAFFVSLAWRLGYTVTVEDFASAAAATAAGVPFVGSEWAHIWRVNANAPVAIRPFRAGAGSAGEPLRTWGNEALECQINRYKPAHTRVLFAYAA